MIMSPTIKQRVNLERKICRAVIKNLLAAGFKISVNNGEEDEIERSTDFRDICKALMTTDEDVLNVYKGIDAIGWIHFIYGNCGYDVIHDYTTNLEPQVSPTNEMCDKAMRELTL